MTLNNIYGFNTKAYEILVIKKVKKSEYNIIAAFPENRGLEALAMAQREHGNIINNPNFSEMAKAIAFGI